MQPVHFAASTNYHGASHLSRALFAEESGSDESSSSDVDDESEEDDE